MDDLQDVLARVGLASLRRYGFALAGGYALQAHGLVERMSEDVDLFTDRWDPESFRQAVEAVLDAYRQVGLEVTVVQQAETFARLRVLDPIARREGSVDLAADGRFPVDEYARYGADAESIASVREAMRSWSAQIQHDLGRKSSSPPRPAVRASRSHRSTALPSGSEAGFNLHS